MHRRDCRPLRLLLAAATQLREQVAHVRPEAIDRTPVAHALTQMHEPAERVLGLWLVPQSAAVVPDGLIVARCINEDAREVEVHLRIALVLLRLQRVRDEVHAQSFGTLWRRGGEQQRGKVVVGHAMHWRNLNGLHVGGRRLSLTTALRSKRRPQIVVLVRRKIRFAAVEIRPRAEPSILRVHRKFGSPRKIRRNLFIKMSGQ